MPREHLHLLTGKLAEPLLQEVMSQVAHKLPIDYTVETLPISVAALLTTPWIAQRWQPPAVATRIILPGYTSGDLEVLRAGLPVLAPHATLELGPKDLRELPRYLSGESGSQLPHPPAAYNIQIIAEINHAPLLTLSELTAQALALHQRGANVIDLGCIPGQVWKGIADATRCLIDAGFHVSVDSLDIEEIALATAAGAKLVLSVNHTNRHAAADWGAEVVVIPDDPHTGAGLEENVSYLQARGVAFRIDPILEPIGFGFAESLFRYRQARQRWPAAAMMMGIGNLTELTDVDSAGVNVLLLAICEELSIHSVLTTQVAPWTQSAVQECDLARRLVHFAIQNQALPKRVDPRLILLRDPRVGTFGEAALDNLAQSIRDHNVRLFAEQGVLHALAEGKRWSADDPFELFDQMAAEMKHPLTPDHAFYLGYELAKATTALTLGKEYRQDEALQWGFLTRSEVSHLTRRKSKLATASPPPPQDVNSDS